MKLLLCNIQRRYQLCVRRNENALVLHRVLRLPGWHDGLIAVWLTINEHVCVWRLLRLISSQLGNHNISWLPVWPLICIISVGEHAESRSFCTICFLAEWLVSFIVMYTCLNTHVSLFVPFFTPILMLMSQWSVPVVLLSRTVYSKLWKNELRTVRNCEKMRHALYQNLKKWVAHCSKLWETLVAHCSLWFQNCGKMSRTLFIN